MVGVQDIIECPQCGGEADYELQTRDMTEWVFCRSCGFRRWSVVVLDRKRGKTSDGHWYYKKTKDGKHMYRFFEKKGYGTVTVIGERGKTIYGLKTGTKEEKEKWKKWSDDSHIKIEFGDE